jgi:hypothetical protein
MIRFIKEWILSGKFLFNKKLAITLWFGLSIIAVLLDFVQYKINNYIIFKYSFLHVQQHVNLYLQYPQQYTDVFLYGPVFSVLIAPFAVLPDWLGITLWVLFNTSILYFAIRKLPIKEGWQNAIIILSSHEMMNASSWVQYNAFIGACIILGFAYILKGKEIWALFFIMFAALTKIYGIVGFAFFFFSKNKFNFIKWAVIWTIVFFVLPIILAAPSYIIQCYKDWIESLTKKDLKNTHASLYDDYQDISVMGMIRRIFKVHDFKNIFVTIPAMIVFALQYVKFKYYSDVRYRLYMLCSVLITTIIFTTSAESPTYIIAFPAVCIWFVIQPPSKWVNAVFVFALLLTSFSYSDIFTPYVRDHIVRPYSLKALPCFVLWMIIAYQIFTNQFLKVNLERGLGSKILNG